MPDIKANIPDFAEIDPACIKRCDGVALHRPDDSAEMFLPPGHRFVIVIDGMNPQAMAPLGSGLWQIVPPPGYVPEGVEWPVLIMAVPEADVEHFCRLVGPEQTHSMIEQIRKPVRMN